MMPGASGDGISLTSEGQLFSTCQQCGNADGTVGHYSDGDLCPGCRVALGPEPEPADIWAENNE